MSKNLPLVAHWDSFPFDCRDVMDRFKLSKFNYFHKDRNAGLMMGFWEVQEGSETIGEVVGGGSADEVMVVLEGEILVSSPGMQPQVARVGDVILCMRHRETRLEVQDRARAFFVVWDIDVEEAGRIFQTEDRGTQSSSGSKELP